MRISDWEFRRVLFRSPGGVLFRLIEDERGWVLQRNGGATGGSVGWQDQYSFTLARVEPSDLEMGNHWTSTRPGTRFTTLCMVSRSEEHTSELQSLMRISYAVFCLKKKKQTTTKIR